MSKKIGNYIKTEEIKKEDKDILLININILEILISFLLFYCVVSLGLFIFSVDLGFAIEALISMLLVGLHILYLCLRDKKKGEM